MRYKYPRTPHVPWSQGASDDDIVAAIPFEGKEVVVTRKMDGENFTGLTTGSHARSPDGRNHPSRDWAKAFWMERSWKLPEGWRISAENCYALHSIAYDNLPGFLLGFAAWDETLTCLSWDDTVQLMYDLDIPMVDTLWRGIWDEKAVRALWDEKDRDTHEGYVVRVTDSFPFTAFGDNVRKFVRRNHVQSDEHWMHKPIVPNKLAPSD